MALLDQGGEVVASLTADAVNEVGGGGFEHVARQLEADAGNDAARQQDQHQKQGGDVDVQREPMRQPLFFRTGHERFPVNGRPVGEHGEGGVV